MGYHILLLFLSYSLKLLNGQDSDEVVINPPDLKVIKSLHDNFYAICNVRGVNNQPIKWHSPAGIEITDADNRIYAEHLNGLARLYIYNISKIDAGPYTCSSSSQGVPIKKTIYLNTFKPITFVNAPLEQEITANSTDKVYCQVSSDPPPKIDWQLVAGKPYLNDRMVVQNDGLLINDVQLSDEGNYTCRASIDILATFEDRNIQVTVTTRPLWIQKPVDTSTILGHRMRVNCKAGGKPTPSLSFYKRGVKINAGERIIINSEVGYLEIESVVKNDEGVYTCQAENSAGSITSNFVLDVKTPPVISEVSNKTVSEGKIASILCMAQGDPAPEITWFKINANGSSDPIGDDKDNVQTYVERIKRPPNSLNSILYLKNVSRKDGGLYSCSATNDAGNASRQLTLTVQYGPAFEGGADGIYYTWPGHSINLSCRADANPAPVYRWTFRDRDLSSDSANIHFDSERGISLFQVDPEPRIYGDGLWKCEATNIYGTAKRYYAIREATLPPTPSEFAFTHVTPTTVTCTLRDAIPMDHLNPTYRIEEIHVTYRRFDQSAIDAQASGQRRILPFGGPGIIDDLEPNTDYVFNFALKNPIGLSTFSKEFHVKTAKVSVPYTPTITSGPTSSSATRHHLVWKEPLDGGKLIKSYEILYSRGILDNHTATFRAFPSEELRKEDIPAPSTSYLLKDLIPGSTYRVEISAVNDIGKSVPGVGFFTTKKDGSFSPLLPKLVSGSGLSGPAWIALIVILALLVLVLVDLYCFYRNRCGLIMMFCVRFCGRKPEPRKNKKHLELRSVDDNVGLGNVVASSNGKIIRALDPDSLEGQNGQPAGDEQHMNGHHHLLALKEEAADVINKGAPGAGGQGGGKVNRHNDNFQSEKVPMISPSTPRSSDNELPFHHHHQTKSGTSKETMA